MLKSNEDIDKLITCSKIIINPPHKEFKEENGHRRNDMTLTSEDGKEHFGVYIRQNNQFPENFSVGLTWKDPNNPSLRAFTLIRCNGEHGGNYNTTAEHFVPHIHKLSFEDYTNSITMPSSKNVKITDKFITLDQAIVFFCKECNIKDAGKYFRLIEQGVLF